MSSNPGTKISNGVLATYGNWGWHNGIWLNGNNVAKDNAFLDNTNANAGYTAAGSHSLGDFVADGISSYGLITGGVHSLAEIYVQGATSPNAISVVGTHTNSAYNEAIVGQSGFLATGTHSSADFYSGGTSEYGLEAVGTYTAAGILVGGGVINGVVAQESNPNGVDFYANGNSAFGFESNGTHSNADIFIPGSAPTGLLIYGSHSSAAISTSNATSPYAITMGNGQRLCFANGGACLLHGGSTLEYQPNGVAVFAIADTGGISVGSGAFTMNGTTALSLTNQGPSGAHATVQEWLTVTDSAGNIRYIPAF